MSVMIRRPARASRFDLQNRGMRPRTVLAFGTVLGAIAIAGLAAVRTTTPTDALESGSTMELQVGGKAGVPSNAEAAVINFTAVAPSQNGYLTAYPCGESRPTAATLNYRAGAPATGNGAIVKLGAGGKVCIYTLQRVEVVADINGWFPAGADYTPRTPNRLLDTRSGNRPSAGSTVELQVAGKAGVPSNAEAAVINFTAVAPSQNGYLTAYPCGESRPTAATLNYRAGAPATGNGAIVKLGAGGKVCIYTLQRVEVVADINGWFPAGADYTPRTPNRLLDTRSGNRPSAGSTVELQVAGKAGVPSNAEAAVINFTAVAPSQNGYLTAYPCGESRPTAATLNYRAGAPATGNGAIVKLGAGGKVCIYTLQRADVVADINGWFPAGADYAPRTPNRLVDTRVPTALLPVYQPNPGCSEANVVPLGQSPSARNFEPLGSIWCYNLNDPPARTAVEGPNSWVDDFTVGCTVEAPGCTSMMSLDDRDMGYRVFDSTGAETPQGQHWINQNHWMVDAKGGFTGGTSLRPDRSFRFENGKIVVEGDFAASIPEYGDETWGEITITSAPAPTGEFADILYAYGQFGGHWAVGCRLQSSRFPVCAVEGADANDPPVEETCFAIPRQYRVAELSSFQRCGTKVMGGGPYDGLERYWRECQPAGPDMACRDRFRLEVTKSSLTLYVNGVKYMEDANWPAAHQLPDSFVNGDIYVYQSNWQNRAGSRAYRYHWDHFAVNPPSGPTPSDLFR